METKVVKTLVSKHVAKVGYRFVFSGHLDECAGCRFRSACLGNLEVGVVYEVVRVYDIVNRCPAVGDVVTVDVRPAEVEIAVNPRAAVEGIVTTYRHIECRIPCGYAELCRSPWVTSGSKVKVVSVGGKVSCGAGKNIVSVKALVLPRREQAPGGVAPRG